MRWQVALRRSIISVTHVHILRRISNKMFRRMVKFVLRGRIVKFYTFFYVTI